MFLFSSNRDTIYNIIYHIHDQFCLFRLLVRFYHMLAYPVGIDLARVGGPPFLDNIYATFSLGSGCIISLFWCV